MIASADRVRARRARELFCEYANERGQLAAGIDHFEALAPMTEINTLLDSHPFAPRTQTLLQAAAWAEACECTIIPAMQEGRWIVSARSRQDLIVEYGIERGLGAMAVAGVCGFAAYGVAPTRIISLASGEDELDQLYRDALEPSMPLTSFIDYMSEEDLARRLQDEVLAVEVALQRERPAMILSAGLHPRADHNRDPDPDPEASYQRLLDSLFSPASEQLTDAERDELLSIARELRNPQDRSLAHTTALVTSASLLVERIRTRSGWEACSAWRVLAELIACAPQS